VSIFVIQHESFEHLGHFADVFASRGVSVAYGNFVQHPGEDAPEAEGLVIMGGPMCANDPLPGLARELKLIEHALHIGLPMLGICLGSQLIAKALGAKVYRNGEPEIGWAPVQLTDAGRHDPVFENTPSPSAFFHWHSDTFDLPAGAVWLAHSEKCRHQAYRYSKNVYGIQFHPEITAEMIAEWCEQPVNCGDVAELRAPIDPRAFDSGPMARQILQSWLDQF
jgi:GMP synthase (glutamine-hydrolysing)